MTRAVSLSINDVPIDLDYFVQDFVDHAVTGMVSVLEGVGAIEKLNISIQEDETTIHVNDTVIPINPFVNKIIKNTLIGMVSSLKGVGEISTVHIAVMK